MHTLLNYNMPLSANKGMLLDDKVGFSLLNVMHDVSCLDGWTGMSSKSEMCTDENILTNSCIIPERDCTFTG